MSMLNEKSLSALAGISLVASATMAVDVSAATTTPETIQFGTPSTGGSTLEFKTFDSSLGSLSGVSLNLDSAISNEARTETARVSILGVEIASKTTSEGGGSESFNFSELDPVSFAGIELNNFLGDGTSTFGILLNFSPGDGSWDGISQAGAGLSVTYEFTPVPLPAALPLMLSGLLGLGTIGRLRSRKVQTSR
jgi:hypothetical protein